MENRRLEETKNQSEDRFEKYAKNHSVSTYGDIKVISTFSGNGMTLTDALSGYIDRMTSLKY